MIDFIVSRPVVITLAILGAVASTAATLIQPRLGAARAKQLNVTGYGFMGVSMLLFIIAGFRA